MRVKLNIARKDNVKILINKKTRMRICQSYLLLLTESVTVVERWEISFHSVGTKTGLRMNGSLIEKNKITGTRASRQYK